MEELTRGELENKIKKLKGIIVNLKMELVSTQIPKGSCPYSKFKTTRKTVDCSTGCEVCRNMFLKCMENHIKEKVEEL